MQVAGAKILDRLDRKVRARFVGSEEVVTRTHGAVFSDGNSGERGVELFREDDGLTRVGVEAAHVVPRRQQEVDNREGQPRRPDIRERFIVSDGRRREAIIAKAQANVVSPD